LLINESLFISRKPEPIWSFWMDVSNDIYWREGIVHAEWTSQPPYGMGSTGEHIHKAMGAMNWEVTGFEKGRSFEFVHTAGGLKGSTAIFKVESENNGSRVSVQMSVSGPFFMRFMMFFMAGKMHKGVRRDLRKLKDLLEKQSP
jgi:hypothetical protein